MTLLELIILIVLHLLLFSPLVWELHDDRKGEVKGMKREDVVLRLFIAFLISFPCLYWHFYFALSSFCLSLAYHFLFFDYLIVIVLQRNEILSKSLSWFTYLGKTADTDQISWWKADPYLRLMIRLIVFVLCLGFYIYSIERYV